MLYFISFLLLLLSISSILIISFLLSLTHLIAFILIHNSSFLVFILTFISVQIQNEHFVILIIKIILALLIHPLHGLPILLIAKIIDGNCLLD